MKKSLIYGALALMSYVQPSFSQTQSFAKETSRITLDSLLFQKVSPKMRDVITILKQVGEREPINPNKDLGTRYKYEFDGSLRVDGVKYKNIHLAYVDYTYGDDRISFSLFTKNIFKDVPIKTYYDGLYAPIDGLPEKGVTVKYNPWHARKVGKTSQQGDLSVFGADLKEVTLESDISAYTLMLDKLLFEYQRLLIPTTFSQKN